MGEGGSAVTDSGAVRVVASGMYIEHCSTPCDGARFELLAVGCTACQPLAIACCCRIVWAQYKDGACSDQIGEYKLGEGADNCPMRSAQHRSLTEA